MGDKNVPPKPARPQNSAPQLPNVPENRVIHGNDITKVVIKGVK